MIDEEIKRVSGEELIRETEEFMTKVYADPEVRNAKVPEDLHDKVFAQIRAYEEQKARERLSPEDKELLRLGKVYRKKQKLSRYVVLAAAVITVVALGTVSIGKGENTLIFLKQIFADGEQTVSDSGSTEISSCIEEQAVFEKIEEIYGFNPVRLEYLPKYTAFQEAVFCVEMQEVNLCYGTDEKVDIIYIIRPNYRESSYAIVIEDEKLQDYTEIINDVEFFISEYNIMDTGENRWVVSWTYQEVQYQLNITDARQEEVEKIIDALSFFE